MREDQKAEVQKLLWCYLKPIPEKEELEKLERLRSYLEEKKIPLDKLRHSFKGTCEETHLKAIHAVTKITVFSIRQTRESLVA